MGEAPNLIWERFEQQALHRERILEIGPTLSTIAWKRHAILGSGDLYRVEPVPDHQVNFPVLEAAVGQALDDGARVGGERLQTTPPPLH